MHLSRRALYAAVFTIIGAGAVAAQNGLDRVLTLQEERRGPDSLSVDWGGSGLWQRLLKLQTTASALYTTAHPDDEQGGTLTWLSRSRGARTAMLTLNRGESGANAIGPELFDGLGLIRTEELLVSDRYYGLDDQYFTTVIDYGYSKTLEESLGKWTMEHVLRDVVRVLRINRPLVLVARFYGGERDGHGNHQTAGVVTQEAWRIAGDPSRFPEQIREEGLRPWQPLKLYRSNLRPRRFFGGSITPPEERWNVRLDVGRFSPWLGQSYQEFSSLGLSFQRSQTSGRRREGSGAYYQYFERVDGRVEAPEREQDFFDGIDTSIPALYRMLGEDAPEEMAGLLGNIQTHVDEAVAAFNMGNPTACVPSLVLGLAATREALELAGSGGDAAFLLRVKEEQFMDAINVALGLQFRAMAVPADTPEEGGPFGPEPTMGPAVPGQSFQVRTSLINGSPLPISVQDVELGGAVPWNISGSAEAATLGRGQEQLASFAVATPADSPLSGRYFTRKSIQDPVYEVPEPQFLHLPGRRPALSATARYQVAGVPIEARTVVYRREARLPFGDELRELKIVPALGVRLEPDNVVVPLGSRSRRVAVSVEVVNSQPGGLEGSLRLEAPEGWRVQPPEQTFAFSADGERRSFTFSVQVPRLEASTYQLKAVASAAGRDYAEGYHVIDYRDYDLRYLYSPATATVHGIDVKIAPGLQVGYVMGVGDEVPAGIEQMGASVTLLGAGDLAGGALGNYDAIVIGTRAYAVRPDLITYNQRLLDYAAAGGNLIVLYQTQEFIPDRWAPYPAQLPRRAEEVSEEDSPVRILQPQHRLFTTPNRITQNDFEGWVEQRGSKFFSEWDDRYVALIETADGGQAPQQGGWVTAPVGQGHYTYFAYAAHRQLPYGVAGAYRIFANLLSLGAN